MTTRSPAIAAKGGAGFDLEVVRPAVGLLIVAIESVLIYIRGGQVASKRGYDALLIQSIAQGRFTVQNDKSYGNIGALYRVLGLAWHPIVVSIIGAVTSALVISACMSAEAVKRYRWTQWVILFLAWFLGFSYLTQYSKDIMVALLAALALSRSSGRAIEVIFVVCALIYGFEFRAYWMAVVAVYIGLRIALKIRRGALWIMFCSMLLLSLIVVGYSIGAHESLAAIRAHNNAGRIGSPDAVTAIVPYIPGSSLPMEVVNDLVTYIYLMVPIPLALLGVTHAVYAGIIFFMWVTFWIGLRKNLASTESCSSNWDRVAMICIAFVVVQSLFEPDFGSSLRHLTPMIPCMVYASAAMPRPRARHKREVVR